MDILQYIKRMNQLYGSEQQVAGKSGMGPGFLIPEEFDELSPREEQYYQQGPFSTREDFLAAKGGSVYNTRKYLQGGRVGLKPGGLVEPGVTHYGQLVQPGPPGVRPGYSGLKNFKKITVGPNKDKWAVSAWDAKTKSNQWNYFDSKPELDAFIKSRPGTGKKTGTTRYDYYDKKGNKLERTLEDKPKQVARKNLDTGKWEKETHRLNKDGERVRIWESQKPNENKSQFFKRVEKEGLLSQKKGRQALDLRKMDATAYIEDWTTNWLDDNLETYKIRQSDKMLKDLSNDWAKHTKTLKDKPWFKTKTVLTRDGFPNIAKPSYLTKAAYKKAWTYDGVKPLTAPLRGNFLKIFYKNKLNTVPQLKEGLNQYFDFINYDKRGWRSGRTQTAFKDIPRVKDVVYLLSKDSGLYGMGKSHFFDLVGGDLDKKYRRFVVKVNDGLQWKQNAKGIEKALGKNTIKELLGETTIQKSMDKERKVLQEIFDLKTLDGTGLGYSIEHGQGLSQAYKTGNKELMKQTLTDLVGTTRDTNFALGRGGFEAQRTSLANAIRRGENVGDNLNSLNKLAKTAYKDLGLKENMYSIKDGQLVSKNVSRPGSTMYDRFGQWAKQIHKTKIGRAEIERQHGSLKNLIEKIGCSGLAAGGRVSFKDGTTCYTRGMDKIKTGNITTAAEKLNFTKLAQTLGPDGWRFLGVDYGPSRTAQFFSEVGKKVAGSPTAVRAPLQVTGKLATGVGRFLADPFFIPLIPLEMMVTSAYGFEKNKDNIMKSLKENPMVTEMARKYDMSAKDVRNAVLEKYRRAVLNTEGGLEEQMAFEPKHQKALETFDKEFYPFWESYEQRPHMDTSFVKDPAFSIGTGSALLGNWQASEEEEHKLRSGEVGGTQFYKKPTYYTKKEFYPKDHPDPALREQLKSEKRIRFENLRGLEDPLPVGFYEGGRVPFVRGKLVDEGRRAFMKWLAGITGAGIVAGTGLIKWGAKKGAGKTVIKAGDHIIQGTPGMPDWFIPLINRITKEGDNVTGKLATVEREIVHTKKIAEGEEVTVYQNLDTGDVRVDYTSPDIMGEGAVGPVQLEYRAGEVITEGPHAGKKTKPEFDAVESEPVSHTMGQDDYAIEWDGTNVVGRAEDLMSDTNKLKQFATKKKPTMGEIVESSKKKKAVQKVHENESDYIVSKQGDYVDYDDYLPDIDDMDY